LKTNIPERPVYDVLEYIVRRGDSVFGIADLFDLKPETVYWANADSFQGAPDTIQVGMLLYIPPVDGVYYLWEEQDTVEDVADRFGVNTEAIIMWPGNRIDLTNPEVKAGDFVMVPGGQKNDQPLFIQTVTRQSGSGDTACGTGFLGRGYFSWPTGNHYLSGYEWGQDGHRGIDIAGFEGAQVYAADSGVVTMASYGEWNYGYGNVVQIDHGNGFVSIYAHLSVVYVTRCQNVTTSTLIGAVGNTGNSFGSHLHFEIRYYNSPVNPWNYLPPP
jgi:murein DD-endopeptidase MepM/ murein hydrolase activator NlpD